MLFCCPNTSKVQNNLTIKGIDFPIHYPKILKILCALRVVNRLSLRTIIECIYSNISILQVNRDYCMISNGL